ncbi:8-amino-7-oxononanoate synthase [Pontibacter rugosus]
MKRYGTNYSSSRRSNLQLQVYEQAEQKLASISGAEAALTMSSGFLVGQTLVQVLRKRGQFKYAPCTHPALWFSPEAAEEANSPITFDAWATNVLQEVEETSSGSFILVCNALDPLQAKAYTFDWLAQLPKNKTFILVVDDSHGFGVCGTAGAGIYQELSKYKHVKIVVVSSLGKALGIPAGIILGPKELIEEVKACSYFGGASPAIPAYLYAFLHADSVFETERQKLQLNIKAFTEGVKHRELFCYIPAYPVFSTRYSQLAAYLEREKILISSFRYPTAESEPFTRVILNSLHTAADIERLAECIHAFVPEAVIE